MIVKLAKAAASTSTSRRLSSTKPRAARPATGSATPTRQTTAELARLVEAERRAAEAMPEEDRGVIRVSIVGDPEHTRQIAKEAEDAARRRWDNVRE
jgi:hypothetical protein